jgi:carboxyl-terminal processing protease
LTTTVWVTPSGRVIQRLAPPPHPLAEEDADTAAGRPKFRTEAGRTVLGGGGIVPDREVSVDPEEPSRSADPSLALARELLARAKTRKALLATPDHS